MPDGDKDFDIARSLGRIEGGLEEIKVAMSDLKSFDGKLDARVTKLETSMNKSVGAVSVIGFLLGMIGDWLMRRLGFNID